MDRFLILFPVVFAFLLILRVFLAMRIQKKPNDQTPHSSFQDRVDRLKESPESSEAVSETVILRLLESWIVRTDLRPREIEKVQEQLSNPNEEISNLAIDILCSQPAGGEYLKDFLTAQESRIMKLVREQEAKMHTKNISREGHPPSSSLQDPAAPSEAFQEDSQEAQCDDGLAAEMGERADTIPGQPASNEGNKPLLEQDGEESDALAMGLENNPDASDLSEKDRFFALQRMIRTGRAGEEFSQEDILQACRHEDSIVVAAALHALAVTTPSVDSERMFRLALGSDIPNIRESAVSAFPRQWGEHACPYLLEMLRDEMEPSVQAALLTTLQDFADQRTLTEIDKHHRRWSSGLQRVAAAIIHKMKKRLREKSQEHASSQNA